MNEDCMAPTEPCICETGVHIHLNRERLLSPCKSMLRSNYRVPHFTSPMERFVVQCRMRVGHDGPHTYHAPSRNVIRWDDNETVVEASGVYSGDDWPAIGDHPQPVDFPPGEVAADLAGLLKELT